MFAVVTQNVCCEVRHKYLCRMCINSSVQRILSKTRLKRLVQCLLFCKIRTIKTASVCLNDCNRLVFVTVIANFSL
jgi:hypothetical protein